MSKPAPSILVLGAAELGSAVLHALTTHPNRNGIPIALSMRPSSIHDPSASKRSQLAHLTKQNITPVALDVEAANQSEISAVFSQYTTIIGCTGMAGSSGLQMKLARAALEAKVPRYIPWQFGVDYDIIGSEAADGHFAAQCDVRKLLRSQTTTRWVIVSTGLFMSFLFEDIFGVVERKDGSTKVRAFGGWENALTVTTVEDIGRCTAEVVLNAPELWQGGEGNGHVVHIAGDTITFEDLANVLQAVTRKDVERELWSTDWLKEMMTQEKQNGIWRYRVIWAEGRGVAWPVSESFNGREGMEMESVEAWIKENLQ